MAKRAKWFTSPYRNQFVGDTVVGSLRRGPGKEFFEPLKKRLLSFARVCRPQVGQRAFQQRQCPATLEEALRREVMRHFQTVAPLGIVDLKGEHMSAASAL